MYRLYVDEYLLERMANLPRFYTLKLEIILELLVDEVVVQEDNMPIAFDIIHIFADD